MKLGTGRTPPGDGIEKYHFPVADGVVLHAGNLDTLKTRIFEYRLRHNIEPGNIERDIDRYYCAKWPAFCHQEASDTNPSLPSELTEPMLNRVSRWASTLVHRMQRGGYELATIAEAERRGAICQQCPKNDGGWRGACGGCSATTLSLLSQIKKMNTTPADGNLGACRIGGWGNSTAIWLSAEALTISGEDKASLPDACWRKALP